MTTAQRNITKSLVVLEDLALGTGTVVQPRGTGHQLDVPICISSESELASLDPEVIKYARLVEGNEVKEYRYVNGAWTNSANLHDKLANRNNVGAHDQIYHRKTTVAEITSGVFSVGDLLDVSDRASAKFKVVSGGTPNGIDILDAGNGNTAVLTIPSLSASYGDTGDGLVGSIAALTRAVESTANVADLRSKTSIKIRSSDSGKIPFADITWPLNTTVYYKGPTGEDVELLNYISNPYQVIATTSTPWAPSTVYGKGTKRLNGGQLYQVVASGTSAASGGPTGTGTAIVDGTVTWKSINNGLYAGVPVNERRIHAPYHPAIVIDYLSPASYGGVNQDAHDYDIAVGDAGGTRTGGYATLLFSKDGGGQWQFVGDSLTDTLSIHKTNAGKLWRLFFNSAHGDIHVQHHDSFGLSDSKPLDVAGGIRVFTDTFIDTTVRSDNASRFSKPEIHLRNRDNLGADNTAKIFLAGSNGYQLQFNAPDSTGLNGQVGSNFAIVAYKSTGETSSLVLNGFYRSLYPVETGLISLGKAGNLFSEVFASTGTINTSDARLKTSVSALTADELNAAKQLAREIGTYKFLASIAEKGDSARKHIGMTVQRAIEIMESNNLDPFEYGFICYNKWGDETIERPAEYEFYENEDGELVQGKLIKEAWTEKTTIAGDAYAFRYDELNQFILAGISARLDALEG